MNLWHLIKRANLNQLWELMTLSLRNIRLLRPTYKATKQSIKYSNEFFGIQHHKNTPANAFRHAVWNWLIAKECSKWKRDSDKILKWTERITRMHEKILPGDELSNAMDIHNNAVGLFIYSVNKTLLPEEVIILLLEMVNHSIKITSMGDLTNIPKDQLVHITEINTP
jgi:hypothetical protein